MSYSRLYARCTREFLEKEPARWEYGHKVAPVLDDVTCHGVAPGEPCLMCERNYADKLDEWKRDVAHGRVSPEPTKPKRSRLVDAPAYAALLAESKARALPERYGADLTDHDRWGLATRHAKGVRAGFVWCLRESGTQLIQARAPERRDARHGFVGLAPFNDTETPARDCESVMRAFSGPLLWYVCRGTDFETIAPVSYQEALEWIRAECYRLEALAVQS